MKCTKCGPAWPLLLQGPSGALQPASAFVCSVETAHTLFILASGGNCAWIHQVASNKTPPRPQTGVCVCVKMCQPKVVEHDQKR